MILAALVFASTAPAVRFLYDSTRLKGIYIDGACILGEDIRTGGGYLIGSADGSDAQGKSIISIGGQGGKMKSDDPARITPPPFSMRFDSGRANTLGFSITIGPVAQDFETISLPFDFGLKMMDRFTFDGTSYTTFCSESDGKVDRNGNTFEAIKPRCEIRDIKGTLIGKVGGASTDAPTSWGEVDGPYATVRFNVASSQHYEKMVFMNHPGTHNLEFSFGRVKKGESCSLAGTIVVSPKSGPSSWVYDGAREFNHQIGRAEADGWSARVGDERERYLCFGPYATEVGAGPRMATFTLMLDNNTFDDADILTLDVADAVSGRVLASREVTRKQLERPMTYQNFSLPFQSPANGRLEFRTLWHGASYVRIKSVTVSR